MSTTSGSRSEASARTSTRGMWRSFVPRNAASLGLARRATASGTRAGSLGPTRSALVRALTARRAFRRRRASTARESCRDPGSRSSSPRLRAAQLSCARVMVQAFPSLCWVRTEERGAQEPRAFTEIGPRSSERLVGPWRSPPTGPAVKTGNPHLSPRGTGSRRWWHSGLGPGVLAAGPATHRQYSYRGPLCEPDQRVCLPRARAVLPPPKSNESPPAVLVAACGCRGCVRPAVGRRSSNMTSVSEARNGRRLDRTRGGSDASRLSSASIEGRRQAAR